MNAQHSIFLSQLPDEILAEIIKHVDGKTVFNTIPVVCKRWHKVSNEYEQFIWKNIFQRESSRKHLLEGDDLERGRTKLSQSLYSIEHRPSSSEKSIQMTDLSGDWKDLWIYFFVTTKQRKKKVRPIHYLPAKNIGKRLSLMVVPILILAGSLGYHFYILNLVATAYYGMMTADTKEEKEQAGGGMSMGGLLACIIIIAMSIFVQLALVGVLVVYGYFQFLLPKYVDRRVTGGISS